MPHSIPPLYIAQLGFWFMDDGEGEGCPADESTASRAPRCRPLRWRDPAAEAVHLGCRHRRFALTSEVASEEQMERLLRRVREG